MLGRSALLAATNSVDYGNWLGNYSAVSLLLRGATTTIPGNPPIDESPIATRKTITVVGNALVSTAVARWNQGSGGSSLAFDGSGDSLTAPSGADFNFGTSPFTVECWVYFNQVNLQYQTIFSLISGSFTAFGFSLNTWTSNQLAFSFYNASPNPTFVITGASNTLTINTWYHVAVTRDSSNVFRLFLNGVKQGTDVTSTLSMIADRTPRVGEWTDSGYAGLNGYIDDLRITKGIARYVEGTGANAGQMVFAGTNDLADPNNFGEFQTNSGPNPDPNWNSVSLLLRNGTPSTVLVNPVDESPQPNTLSISSLLVSTTVFKYGTSSLLFGGVTLTIPYTPRLILGGVDSTIEMWIYPNSFGAENNLIIQVSNPAPRNFRLLLDSSGFLNLQEMLPYQASTYKSSQAFTTGNWQHLAVVRLGSTVTMFRNGLPIGTFFSIDFGQTQLATNIGHYPGETLYRFNGYIDDLRITKGVARYTSNFTPPPAELPNF